jgi:membrane associated rhomboid family serine protease
MGRRIWVIAVLVVAFSTLFVPVASAYVDAGSGSFVFQAAVGGLLAAGVAVKVFWKRIVSTIRRKDPSGGV